MVALAILSAGLYILGLVPFKSIPLIPGFTEIRPAGIFPVLFGLLFGPAGAWGCAIGNLVADLFGTLSAGSIFGFIGNFFLALIPYKIWGRLGNFYRKDRTPAINSPRNLMELAIISIIASSSCAVIIGWGLDMLKLLPFVSISIIILLNNTVMSLVFGPLLLPMLYKKVKKWGLLWTDIMNSYDISNPAYPDIYSLMVVIGSIGSLVTGLAVSLLFAWKAGFSFVPVNMPMGNIFFGVSVLPFLVVLFYGSLKL